MTLEKIAFWTLAGAFVALFVVIAKKYDLRWCALIRDADGTGVSRMGVVLWAIVFTQFYFWWFAKEEPETLRYAFYSVLSYLGFIKTGNKIAGIWEKKLDNDKKGESCS